MLRRLPRASALWRSVVPWHPATAWAIAASALVFVTSGISHGFDSGVRGGVATFLAWAVVRELAPKRAVASLLAPFAAVAFAIPAETDLLACTGVLLAARITARTVGDPPTLLDHAALVPLLAWMATRPAGFPVAVVVAAACFAESHRARSRLAGLVLLALAAAAAAWSLVVPLPARLRPRDDRRRGHLVGARIRAARLVALACVGAAIGWVGTDGAFALSAGCAALLAAGLGGAGQRPARRPSDA